MATLLGLVACLLGYGLGAGITQRLFGPLLVGHDRRHALVGILWPLCLLVGIPCALAGMLSGFGDMRSLVHPKERRAKRELRKELQDWLNMKQVVLELIYTSTAEGAPRSFDGAVMADLCKLKVLYLQDRGRQFVDVWLCSPPSIGPPGGSPEWAHLLSLKHGAYTFSEGCQELFGADFNIREIEDGASRVVRKQLTR